MSIQVWQKKHGPMERSQEPTEMDKSVEHVGDFLRIRQWS
jgi:hypothetical protein